MKKLNNKELEKIIGGASGLTVTTVIGAIIVFATGIFDGFVRPFTCRGVTK